MSLAASGLPFDDVRNLLESLPEGDEGAVSTMRSRLSTSALPGGDGGELLELADWLARWTSLPKPQVMRPLVALFVGTHGLSQELSATQDAQTLRKWLEAYASGAGAVNAVCAAHGLGLRVFDLALDYPTGDIRLEDAMDEKTAAATMAFGMEALAGGTDCLGVGAIGVGNDVSALCLAAALLNGPLDAWLDEVALLGADAPVKQAGLEALDRHHKHAADSLEAMRRLGTREIAAIAGAILAARTQRIPVVLDGLSASVAALVLKRQNANAVDHCVIGQSAKSKGAVAIADALDLTICNQLNMQWSDGVGAALTMPLLRSAADVATQVAQRDAVGL